MKIVFSGQKLFKICSVFSIIIRLNDSNGSVGYIFNGINSKNVRCFSGEVDDQFNFLTYNNNNNNNLIYLLSKKRTKSKKKIHGRNSTEKTSKGKRPLAEALIHAVEMSCVHIYFFVNVITFIIFTLFRISQTFHLMI